MVLLVTTNKTQNCNSDRKFSRVKFLILPRILAGGKNKTEESLCFSSYIGSYAKMSQPTVLGVGAIHIRELDDRTNVAGKSRRHTHTVRR
jgi:hypothetical protein